MSTSSVLILNFNGKRLLEKNLHSVIKAAHFSTSEVVVVDNGSQDGSADFVRHDFPSVQCLDFKKNFGYSEGNNRAVQCVESEVVILLNNDVIPEQNAFKTLLRHFKDKTIFAVSSRQVVKAEKSDFLGGVAIPEFSRGLWRHRPIEISGTKVVNQLYASGGAAAFDRKKFLELGGFDSLYAPFYWEDADLSARAWARGWKVFFDPQSVVEHRHESTVKRVFPTWYVKTIGDRNMLLFNWRHLNGGKYWSHHLLWLPVHIVHRPLGFLFTLPKIPAVISRRLNDQYRIDLDKLLSNI